MTGSLRELRGSILANEAQTGRRDVEARRTFNRELHSLRGGDKYEELSYNDLEHNDDLEKKRGCVRLRFTATETISKGFYTRRRYYYLNCERGRVILYRLKGGRMAGKGEFPSDHDEPFYVRKKDVTGYKLISYKQNIKSNSISFKLSNRSDTMVFEKVYDGISKDTLEGILGNTCSCEQQQPRPTYITLTKKGSKVIRMADEVDYGDKKAVSVHVGSYDEYEYEGKAYLIDKTNKMVRTNENMVKPIKIDNIQIKTLTDGNLQVKTDEWDGIVLQLEKELQRMRKRSARSAGQTSS